MIRNFFRIAIRVAIRNKLYTIINITGLGIGLACFILIALFVTNELRYDHFHEKSDRIYRVDAHLKFGGLDQHFAVSSDPMGATLKKDYPEVEAFARLYPTSLQVKKDNAFIDEADVTYADSTLFDIFSFPAIAGDAHTALVQPDAAVVAASTARKYFGTTDAVGKVLETSAGNYKITAVIEDMPDNSTLQFDILLSMHNVRYIYDLGNYLSHNFPTYILLKEGTDPADIDAKFPEVVNKYLLPQAKEYMEISSIEEFEKAGNRLGYFLMPLTDIHLHSHKVAELGTNGDIKYVYIFSAVALFILLIACINFMNLSTAKSTNRAREVGIRKVLGSERLALIRQFILESILMAGVAVILALLLIILLLPYFNALTGKTFHLGLLTSPGNIAFLVLLTLVIGLLAGSYPAVFLSRFKPVAVLKGKILSGAGKSIFRNSLVVFQFTICIILITGTLVVNRQLNFILNKKLGYNKEQLLILEGTRALANNTGAFKQQLLQIPGVISGTYSDYLPVTSSSRTDYSYSREAVMTAENGINIQGWRVDYDYINTMGMEILKGRNFSKDFPSDSNAVIINETTAAWLGKGDPIGKKIYTDVESYTVVGMVKNFNYESLKHSIGPLLMELGKSESRITLRIDTKNMDALIAQVKSRWEALAQGHPFNYRFMDESFAKMYHNEQQVGRIAFTFALLAIFIACLGLFGLVTYMVEQRTKEIGIRKVLGANVKGIVKLMSYDFVRLIVVAKTSKV